MKKRSLVLSLLLAALLLSGCSGSDNLTAASATQTPAATSLAAESAIDVDLTQMSSTMVYSYVFTIVSAPMNYVGQRFKLSGISDESYSSETDTTYHYIVIADASACCAQGLEYILPDSAAYPAKGSEIVITGTLESYVELGDTANPYYHIVSDAIAF